MKGDRVEILVDAGTGSVERFEISATKAGRFMASRVVALVEHPALEGDGGVEETTQRRLGGDTATS